MPTSSDSLFNVLSRINRNQIPVQYSTSGYTNVVSLVFSDQVFVSEPNVYFPDNKLLVDRFSDDFVNQNSSLLEKFLIKIKNQHRGLNIVWVTTSHIVKQHQYLLELTFE